MTAYYVLYGAIGQGLELQEDLKVRQQSRSDELEKTNRKGNFAKAGIKVRSKEFRVKDLNG